jgi:hypothetical protein
MLAAGFPPEQAQMQAQAVMQQLMTDPNTGLPYDPLNSWKVITQDGINGRFDFDIEAESPTQTLSMRRADAVVGPDRHGDPYFRRVRSVKT